MYRLISGFPIVVMAAVIYRPWIDRVGARFVNAIGRWLKRRGVGVDHVDLNASRWTAHVRFGEEFVDLGSAETCKDAQQIVDDYAAVRGWIKRDLARVS